MEEQLNQGQRNLEIDNLTIVTLGGDSKDFTPFYTEIRIFESLYAPALEADVVIVDPENLIEDMPIVGGETVHLKLRTTTFDDSPGTVIARSFQVRSIINRGLDNDRQQNYTLQLCSPELLRDTAFKLGRAIPGEGGDTNTEAIATQLFNDYVALQPRYLPDGDTPKLSIMGTPHTSSIQYISNHWSVFQNMNYLCRKIEASDISGSDFFFFESNKDWYLSSLQHIILEGQDSYFEEYHYTQPSLPYQNRQDGSFSGTALPDYFTRIQEIEIPRTIDIADANMSGYSCGNIQAYDMFNKKFKHITLDMTEDFENYVTTDKHLPMPSGLPKDHTAYTSVKILNSYNWNNPEQSSGVNDDALSSHYTADAMRKQYISSFNDYQFLISVPGRTDIEVGRCIKFFFPKPQAKSGDDVYVEDENLSGLYVITEIKHRINPVDYTMTLRITKNGTANSLGGM